MARGRHANPATGAFGGAPYGATNSVEGCADMGRGRHANPATGAFGGAPYGATILMRGVPKMDDGSNADDDEDGDADRQTGAIDQRRAARRKKRKQLANTSECENHISALASSVLGMV